MRRFYSRLWAARLESSFTFVEVTAFIVMWQLDREVAELSSWR